MKHCPSAFWCHAASPSCTTSPVRCTAKSMIVVVPPNAAARVPVSNVSLANVPPNGSSMWVCASTPPGITYLPVASTTCTPSPGKPPGANRAAMVPPSTSTSAGTAPVGPTTVPPLISSVMPASSRLHERVVGVRAPVAVEGPPVAHLVEQVHVQVPYQQFRLVGVADLADELAPRVHTAGLQ